MESYFVAMAFGIGFLIHCLRVADRDVHIGCFPNILGWFKQYWLSVLVRGAICLIIWTMYTTDPTLVVKALGYFGINFNLALPATKCVASLVGYFADSLLDALSSRVPFLKREIPVDFGGGSNELKPNDPPVSSK